MRTCEQCGQEFSRRNAERRPQQGAVAIRYLLDLMEGQDQ